MITAFLFSVSHSVSIRRICWLLLLIWTCRVRLRWTWCQVVSHSPVSPWLITVISCLPLCPVCTYSLVRVAAGSRFVCGVTAQRRLPVAGTKSGQLCHSLSLSLLLGQKTSSMTQRSTLIIVGALWPGCHRYREGKRARERERVWWTFNPPTDIQSTDNKLTYCNE